MKQLKSTHYSYLDEIFQIEDVHDKYRLKGGAINVVFFVIAALILSFFQAINLYIWLKGSLGGMVPVLFHLIMAAIPAVLAIGQIKAEKDGRFFYLLSMSSFIAGVLGSLGAVICVVLYSIFSRNSMDFIEWFKSIFPDEEMSDSEEVYARLETGADEQPLPYSVMSFEEVMDIGSEADKRQALTRMTSMFDPRFAGAFKKALQDSNHAVRVQAASSVSVIENSFSEQLAKIEEMHERDANNPRLLYVLARFYDDYSFTGVLDPDRERRNREQAIKCYKEYLETDPNNAEVWLAIGRLHYRSGEMVSAIEWFEQTLRHGHNVHNIHTVLPWYLECLYALGRFGEIRQAVSQFANQIKYDEAIPEHIKSATHLWAPQFAGEQSA